MLSNARLHISIAVAVLSGGACSSSSPASTDGAVSDGVVCPVPAPTACPSPSPHYADVAPIIQANCGGLCHSGVPADGPWPLTEYQHVADWADVIGPMVADCLMPPPDAGVSMTTADRLALLTWLLCGAPP
jgi:hypothetical protein